MRYFTPGLSSGAASPSPPSHPHSTPPPLILEGREGERSHPDGVNGSFRFPGRKDSYFVWRLIAMVEIELLRRLIFQSPIQFIS